ncbi:ribonuclease H-like domain-containing protein [Tanacetum coccineum]
MPVSTARPISTTRSFASKIAQTGSAIRPIYSRMDNVRPRALCSSVFRPKELKQDVKTSRVKNISTAGTRAVRICKNHKKTIKNQTNTDMGMEEHTRDGSFYTKGNPEIFLQDHAVVDSGCSSHMTGNKAYLSDYEDYNGGFVKVIPNEFNLFSVSQTCDKKNSVLFTETECLIMSPSFKLLDESQDEGYLLGYSTTIKTFRVYNKKTKRVEENLHIDFLEDQPNVAGTSPDWMFDLDFLTNTMNYIPLSVENQVHVDTGTQDSYVAGSSGKDKESTQEYILLLLHPLGPRISVEDVVQATKEKPSENAPEDKEVQGSEDVAENEEQHKLTEAEQALKDDLEKMIGANAGESSFFYLGGQIPIDASTLPNADLSSDLNMPGLEDDSDVFPKEGIFSRAYDDEDVGAEADFNNMDSSIDVSPIPTLRIHKDHPKGQILGDPKSVIQTKGKIQKASLVQQALDNGDNILKSINEGLFHMGTGLRCYCAGSDGGIVLQGSYPASLGINDPGKLYTTSRYSLDGSKYFLTVVDDFTRAVWVFLLKGKDEVFHHIVIFYNLVKNQFDKTIKVFRCDNGTEFIKQNMDKFCKEKGILHQTSCPYTLERITKKRTKNKAKTTKPGTEWKSCEGQSQIKAKDQKSQSQSQLNKLTVKTGAVIEEYYWLQSQPI